MTNTAKKDDTIETKVFVTEPIKGTKLDYMVKKMEWYEDGKRYFGTAPVINLFGDIARYRLHPTKVWFGAMKDKSYECGNDMKMAAWILAYRHVLLMNDYFPINSSYHKAIKPVSAEGIKMWDDIMIQVIDDNRLNPDDIVDLIINKDTRDSYVDGYEYQHHQQVYEYLHGKDIPFNDQDIEFETRDFDSKDVEKPHKDNKIIYIAGPVYVDPVTSEHPEDDVPVAEVVNESSDNVKEEPIFGPKIKGYMIEDEIKSFNQVMKNAISFGDEESEKPVDLNDPVAAINASNKVFEAQYLPLVDFTKFIEDNGLHLVYGAWDIPAGRLISVHFYDNTTPAPINQLFIDPNVLYRNGYNVLTANKDGDIIREAVCSIDDRETILTMVHDQLDKKTLRKLNSRLPYGTKAVMEMVDFSGLNTHEPLSVSEWKKLITNIYSIIKTSEDWKFRAKLVEYNNPEKFKLVCDDTVLPILHDGYGKDYSEITKTSEDAGFWITFDSEKYGKEKKYEFLDSASK